MSSMQSLDGSAAGSSPLAQRLAKKMLGGRTAGTLTGSAQPEPGPADAPAATPQAMGVPDRSFTVPTGPRTNTADAAQVAADPNASGTPAKLDAAEMSSRTAHGADVAVGADTRDDSQPDPAAADLGSANWEDPTAYYDRANSAIDAQEKNTRQFGNDAIAAGQRRAATLSALSGRGIGGSYLQGQTTATLQGVNNTQQAINQLESQRQAIYGMEAGNAFIAQQRGLDRTSDLDLKTADNKAAAGAQDFNGQKSDGISTASSQLGSYGIDPVANHGPAWGSAKPLFDAMANAHSPAEYAAANQKLQGFISQLAKLRAQNPGKKGSDWDQIVKEAERSGFFGAGYSQPAPLPAAGVGGTPTQQY